MNNHQLQFVRVEFYQNGNRAYEQAVRASEEQWKRGYLMGLDEAVKMAEWLNVQPPRKWAQELRAKVLKEVDALRKKLDEQ
jgi:hypothetical protein